MYTRNHVLSSIVVIKALDDNVQDFFFLVKRI